jgi:hypothetical protein
MSTMPAPQVKNDSARATIDRSASFPIVSSPGVSPSRFYLFGTVKAALVGCEIADEIGFLATVADILSGLLRGEVRAIFGNWIEHVRNVRKADGDSLLMNRAIIII